MRFLGFQPHLHVNTPDHEDIVLQLDLAHCCPGQSMGLSFLVIELDFLRKMRCSTCLSPKALRKLRRSRDRYL